METEDLKKAKKELQKEIKKNNEQIATNNERTRMAKVNQFEYKVVETLIFSMLPYCCWFVLFLILTQNGTMASILSTIPTESLPFIIVGSSLGIGTIWRKISDWKFKIKERLKAFTNAKTQSEKLQEEVKYAIELEKSKNRNKAIQQTMNLLNSNQSILNSLGNECDINNKFVPKTREDSQKRVEKISMLLNEKYDELDVLTTQKVLHKKFWKVRTSVRVMDVMLTGMLGGIFATMVSDMPLIMIGMSGNSLTTYSPVSSSLLFILAPIIVGTAGSSVYMIKRNKDYEKTFNILNGELGENALPDKIKEAYEEQQDIDAKIANQMREISIVEIQLQEQKRIMESFADDGNEKIETLEPSVSKKPIIEEIRKNTIFEHNQEDLMTFMDKDLFGVSEREPQIEENGPSLVLRRKPNNTQK